MKLRLLGLGICGSLLALTVAGALLTRLHPPTHYADGLVQLCALVITLATVRLWVHLLGACRAAWAGLPVPTRSPLIGRVVVAVCGASVVAMAPAYAETPPDRPDSNVFVLDGLPLPEVPTQPVRDPALTPPEPEPRHTRPKPVTRTSPPAEDDSPRHSVPTHAPSAYVVQPGDSLWALARRFVPDASDRQILAIIAAWHAHNRAVIGPDPSLIFPGQHLDLSTGATS